MGTYMEGLMEIIVNLIFGYGRLSYHGQFASYIRVICREERGLSNTDPGGRNTAICAPFD